MTLYEIDAAIMAVLEQADPETGELDMDALDSLEMARTDKCEGIALALKNQQAEADAIKVEVKALQERAKRAQKKADSLKGYLSYALAGEKLTTPKVAVSYRRSTAVAQAPDAKLDALPSEYKKIIIEANKSAIKDALKSPNGETAEKLNSLGWSLEERRSVVVK